MAQLNLVGNIVGLSMVVDVRDNMKDYVYPDGIIRPEYIDYTTKQEAEAALVAYLEK